MIVLDASVLIGYLSNRDPHHEAALDVIRTGVGEGLGVATVTLAEVLVGPARKGPRALALTHSVLRELGVVELAPGDGAAQAKAMIRASSGLRLPDCVVVEAAEVRQARLATFDQRLAAAARERGVHVVGVD